MKKPTTIDNEVVLDKQRIIRRQFNKWRERRKPDFYEILEKRITEYFRFCEEMSMTPAVESCSLAIGISRQTFFRWRQGKGCSPVWQQAIDRAYQTILAAVETDGIAGKITPVLTIWLQKNYGYKDTVSLEEQVNQRNLSYSETYMLPEDILKQYLPESEIEDIKNNPRRLEPEDIWVSEESAVQPIPDWLYGHE